MTETNMSTHIPVQSPGPSPLPIQGPANPPPPKLDIFNLDLTVQGPPYPHPDVLKLVQYEA